MKKINVNNTLWVEKYRPQTLLDCILTKDKEIFFKNIIKTGDIPNLLFYGTAGVGKTTLAKCIGKDLNCDILYINASLENSIDNIRYNVKQFAYTNSVFGNKKLVILDEAERITAGQDALKVLLEESSENARFIFCTNNIHKIIDPLKSRTQLVNFQITNDEDIKDIMLKYFKRVQYILKEENIEYDKQTVSIFIKKLFPDFRKIINELQKYSITYGKIDNNIISVIDVTSNIDALILAMKNKNFNEIRSICSKIDVSEFLAYFYEKLDEYLDNKCKAVIITEDLKYLAFEAALSLNPEITLVATCLNIAQKAIWR